MSNTKQKADAVICGAGISGISAAYHLAVKQGMGNVVLVDPREPMTLTSDKSTECYRNWWPGPGDAMVRLMNHSIDLLEELANESNNYFGLNRRGYVFLTSREERVEEYRQSAELISGLGAGDLRIHEDVATSQYLPPLAEAYQGQPTGADLVVDPAIIQQTFPFITDKAIAMLHTRRCGWLSAQQLGTYLLDRAREAGVTLVRAQVADINVEVGRVAGVSLDNGGEITTSNFINCAGPYLNQVSQMLGVDLPVYNELHAKIALKDYLGVVPGGVPLMLWDDPVHLLWSEEERQELAADPEMRWLLDEFPSGVHFKPEGAGDSPMLLALWTYDVHEQEPVWPPSFDPMYPEIVLRGLVHLVPGLEAYIGRMRKPNLDGGYYCKTRENRPLIGPTSVEGAYVFGAVSGFGIMSAMAGGELLAQHVVGAELPEYADAFRLSRYEDPEYLALLAKIDATSGQL
ncbi:MAG: FAD-binding oxidoreductase [Chloroflexi bacterium]|nr:MAG: FAD-binding oxidoreductase [Chloroflexota bacterium]MBL1195921.1 FAD-binding oxidoreductase [Chloroflexota bacterium]NOH13214.1 FAD-binding oxidoreductase [Chloroflexota bacterium]